MRKVSFTIFLLFGVLYSSWLVIQTQQGKARNTIDLQRPDAFIEDVVATDMDKNGKPHSKLIAPRIVHYASHNTSVMTEPHFIFYSENEQPWHTTSEHGKAINGNEQLELWDNVKIHQPAGRANRESTMTTEAIRYYVNQSYAHTEKPVQIHSPGTTVQAVGMKAWFKEKKVLLLSKTRGTHEKSKKNVL